MDWETNWIENRSRLTPDKKAVVDAETGQSWTYHQLNERSGRLASHLKSLGCKKGDRVALLSPNDISFFDLFFACGKIGAIFVPLNWRLNAAELTYILQDCTPKFVMYDGSLKSLIDELPVSAFLQTDGQFYQDVMSNGRVLEPTEEVLAHDPSMIIYTGGTTGKPKGVVLLHQSVFWNAINTVISWNLTADDITPTCLPMFHTGGLNALSFPILHIGGIVVIVRSFDQEKVFDLLNRERCTIALMVPTMYHLMSRSPQFATADFPTMRIFLSGGAPCPQSVYDAFGKKGFFFKEGYGLTEAGPNNFYLQPKDAPLKRGSVGKPMLYNKVKIVNENGQETGPDETGELLLQGNHLFDRYWNNPEATRKALVDGWFYTGDYGKVDRDGYYYIVGRKKDMIITGGENVYPKEVENAIEKIASVNEVAVVGLPDERWGEAVTAVVAVQTGFELTIDQLREHCERYLAKYKIPKKMIIVDEIPKTLVGKIDKKVIIEKFS